MPPLSQIIKIQIVRIKRGEAAYHGSGQLVIYPKVCTKIIHLASNFAHGYAQRQKNVLMVNNAPRIKLQIMFVLSSFSLAIWAIM